ncbi:hypothetical protein AAG906_022080 [Vitis piasezkii]
MHGLMHKLGTEWKEVYLRVLLVTLGMHPMPFPWPSKLTENEELVIHDHFHLCSMILAPSKRGERRRKMVMCSNAKHLTQEVGISYFEPYLFPLDVSYQNINEVVLWLAAYKKEVVDIVFKMFNFMTPDVPTQPNDHGCKIFIMKVMDYWSMGGLSKSINVLKKYRLKIMDKLLFSTHNAYRHQFMAE